MQITPVSSINHSCIMAGLLIGLCFLSMSGCHHSWPPTKQPHLPLKSALGSIAKKVVNRQGTDEQSDSAADFLIIPGSSVGKITANTTLADLQSWYGKANVQTGPVPVNEGGTLPGAVLFPRNPNKTFKIFWKTDKSYTPTVQSVLIEAPNTYWHTEEGIRVGTSLQQLETLNGHSFTLSGFDWDYGGLSLRLAPPATVSSSPSLEGDGAFYSSNPEMRKLNPQVVGLGVFL